MIRKANNVDVHKYIDDRTKDENNPLNPFWEAIIAGIGEPGKPVPPRPQKIGPLISTRAKSAGKTRYVEIVPADFERGVLSALQNVETVVISEDSTHHVHAAMEALRRIQSPNASHEAGVDVVRDAVQNVGLKGVSRMTRGAGK